MASIYDHEAYRQVFGNIHVGPKVLEALNKSSLFSALIAEYRSAVSSGMMTPFSTDHPEGSWSRTPGTNGYFIDQRQNQPGSIRLNPEWLSRGDAEQAYLIIHELGHFRFRASNAAMMEAINKRDINGYVVAYLRREAEAEALTDRVAWELKQLGFEFAPGTAGGVQLSFKALRYQNIVSSMRAANPSASDGDVLSAAIDSHWDRLKSGDSTRLGEACRAAFNGMAQAEIDELKPGSICDYVTVSTNADGTLPKSVDFGLDTGPGVSAIAHDDGSYAVVFTINNSLQGGSLLVERYNEAGDLTSRSVIDFFHDEKGIRRIETVVQADGVYRNSYDTDGKPESSYKISEIGLDAQRAAQFGNALNDINILVDAIKSGRAVPILASGVRLLTTLNPGNSSLGAVSTIAGGVASFYNLYNALENGSDFAKLNATLSTISFSNQLLLANGAGSAALNTFLNGPVNGVAGGSVGVLPALGLVASIKAKDPIGAAMSIGAIWEGSAFLTSNPVGWALMGASILRAFFDDGPPDAWGVAKVTYGEGFTNYNPQVHASGENFGPERARAQLQSTVDTLMQITSANNAAKADSTQHLGIIPQRMPSLTFRAAEFADKGYAVVDIDPLTGTQRAPSLRFDDKGRVFGADPSMLTADERAMLALPGQGAVPPLVAYMLNSALQRGAIAPTWEVRTAKMQDEAGDPNAGLSEEERAAKIGLAAPLDAHYAATHPNDPQARTRRQGQFMVVGLDMSGDGRIDSRTVAQNQAAGHDITFDWDGQGFQKKTGWISAADGFLVLDHNFNQSTDGAKELLSNPLVADAGKGLRLLSAYDANGDGRIDGSDPVFEHLKVWQDLNQDGDNTNAITIGAVQRLVQDESGGVMELRSLSGAGITAIDYANSRFELGAGNFRQIATQVLEAEQEGVRYSPVGAGIQIEMTNGEPQVLITQVQSEAAVYDGLQIAAGGEAIGTPGAELYEDGLPVAYDPVVDGGPREIIISAAHLLENDTWAGLTGVSAGLAITSVRAGDHTAVGLRPDGDVSLLLEANYQGAAEFFYTVALPGQEALIAPREARVVLDITSVNDAPVVRYEYSPERPIYGYQPTAWSAQLTPETDQSVGTYASGTERGRPYYQPYVESIPPQPIYGTVWNGDTQESVIIGYTPAQDIPHTTVIATDKPNTGRVLAGDPDGGSFSFKVLSQPLYGKASVDPAGNWNYVGRRPGGLTMPDKTGDGLTDWTSFDPPHTPLFGWMVTHPGNVCSNDYGPDEPGSNFLDYFWVRVFDDSDPSGQTFRDIEVAATHYGPQPIPEVSDSGGSPIAIDLDGDGFHFTDVDDSNVFFDVNGDGWKRRIAWPSPGDGLLAFDRDGNGKIERLDEISFVPYAPDQQTDMSALREAFDTNGDGRFDANDARWNEFGIWRDADSNGVTDPGEFRSLADLGVTGIDLATDGQFRVIDGQTVHGIGTATKADGTQLAVADVTLRYSNETQVTTANPDGTTATSTTTVPAFTKGQEFTGTSDKDLVFGTRGSDAFVMAGGDDVVVDDGGDDVVDGGAGDDQIYTGSGNDVIYGGAGSDAIFSGVGNDLVFGDGLEGWGDDLLMLEDGNDVAFGGEGNDFISGGSGNDILSGNLGNDRLFGEAGWDALFGEEGDDELWGMDGNDLLYGDVGNDLLSGAAGDDTMEGGQGDDTYEVDAVGDTVLEAAGEGIDTVHASIAYTLGGHVENLRLTGTDSLAGTGNELDNVLVGNDGDNALTGLAGNDSLDGGLGADILAGGAGDDTYHVDNAGDLVVEAAGAGTDSVRGRISTQLAANVENLTLVGVNAIDGTGNALDNVLVGNVASNVLDGQAGADTMRGGRGDDMYVVDDRGDQVVEAAGEGTDTVESSVGYGLSANVENLHLTGAADTDATGNDLDNQLVGNSGSNVLDGGSGADTMAGGAGDDSYVVDSLDDQVVEQEGAGIDTVFSAVSRELSANVENLALMGDADLAGTGNLLDNRLAGNAGHNILDGRAGADTMAGARGDDLYLVDDALDTVVERADEGNDEVRSSVSYTLSAHVETLTLTGSAHLGGTGNETDNLLTGNSGANRLDGAGGADRMAGGAGDDVYIVDNVSDTVQEGAAEGTDTLYASVSYTLSGQVENLVLTGTDDIAGIGNELDNRLAGNQANNLLDGAGGADAMAGAQGHDTYVVDDIGDSIVELEGQGTDSVLAGVSHGLAANVENLTLTGTSDIDATGNDLDNELIGNSGSNTLDGAGGADRMAGGAADDLYVVDHAADQVLELAGDGTDTVLAGVGYGLSADVENLTLTGTGNTDATGNGLDNRLAGNSGNNLLDGGAGADWMAGGQGNDTYLVDSAADITAEGVGEGTDQVLSSVSHALAENVENLALAGSAGIDATGNGLDNVLLGNAGANMLDGRAGADQMSAGAGDDSYVVDDAGDAVIEWFGQGTDTVFSGIDYVLPEHVENLRLIGSAARGGGNAQDNVLFGNGLGNRLDGAGGADAMRGGAGDDTYVVDSAGDDVIEAVAQGDDRVEAGIDYALTANVERLLLTGNAVTGVGNELDNELRGNAQANRLDGALGADHMAGATGDDTYFVDNAGDTIEEHAGEGHDTVVASVTHALSAGVDDLRLAGADSIDGTGNELANLLAGNLGNNRLAGGAGDDIYEYALGGGLDTIVETSGVETLRFGPGLSLDNVALRIATVDGRKVAQIRVLNAEGNEMSDQGVDFEMGIDAQNRLASPIETFRMDDGTTYVWSDLLIQSTSLAGGRSSDLLIAGRNDDFIEGGFGNDAIYGGSGHDSLLGGHGDDILFGGGGQDELRGGNDADELYGEAGDDKLWGENGNDVLIDLKGNNNLSGGNQSDILQGGAGDDVIDGGVDADLATGGAGSDRLVMGVGDDWVAGGAGNDMIEAGGGRNLIAFHRGDGADTLYGSGKDILSLGAIAYADMVMSRSGSDLLLGLGQGDSMTLKDWYAGNKYRSVEKLQVATSDTDYTPGSADEIGNQRVEVFDFARLVQRFDAARAADASQSAGWSVMNGLLDAHLQGSDTAALGGDLSFQYATAGSLAGIGIAAAQASLAAGSADWQVLKPRAELEQGSVRLV